MIFESAYLSAWPDHMIRLEFSAGKECRLIEINLTVGAQSDKTSAALREMADAIDKTAAGDGHSAWKPLG